MDKNEIENQKIKQYASVILLTLIIYFLCFMIDGKNYLKINFLEITLLIVCSIVLVYFYNMGYDFEIYGTFLLISLILLTFLPYYAFMVLISLLSMLIIVCIYKIRHNELDYKLEY